MDNKAALIIVDVQVDFCPGGKLAVPNGDKVVPQLNRYIDIFVTMGLPVHATRDWHPEKTKHFKEFGGKWPQHCVVGTPGAALHPGLVLPKGAVLFSKGSGRDEEGYSGFDGRDEAGRGLAETLRASGVTDVYVGGLATDYCVRATVLDAVGRGFKAVLLIDAARGVDLNPGDSQKAIDDMLRSGAAVKAFDTVRAALKKNSRAKEAVTT